MGGVIVKNLIYFLLARNRSYLLLTLQSFTFRRAWCLSLPLYPCRPQCQWEESHSWSDASTRSTTATFELAMCQWMKSTCTRQAFGAENASCSTPVWWCCLCWLCLILRYGEQVFFGWWGKSSALKILIYQSFHEFSADDMVDLCLWLYIALLVKKFFISWITNE